METPIAAPVAAPAPAVSAPAPVSAPVATPTLAPAAEPVAAPTPVSTETPAVPAIETPAAAPAAKPQRGDFSDDAKGIEDFLKANNAWEEANPDGIALVTGDEVNVDPDAAPAPEKTAEEIAAEADAAADKAVEPEKKEPEVAAPTPEGLSKILEEHPDLKAALEAAPEAKGALYAMARQNAKAAPILEVFPGGVEAAKFASSTANEFVGLKTAIQLADAPEKMGHAVEGFLDQFKIVDDKGQPVLDAKGQPTYGDDLPLFTKDITTRTVTAKISEIKDRLEANNFATAEGKDNAEQALAALEFGLAYLNADDEDALDKPNLETLTPEQKAWQEREQAKIDAEKDRLGIKDKNLTQKEKVAVRAKFDTKFREEFGGSTGKFMANYLKGQEEAGVAIPRYLLTMKDPKSGISVFAQQAFARLNAKLDGLSDVKSNSATYQMNAINEQGLKARVEYGQTLIDQYLPDIIDAMLAEAGVSIKKDAEDNIASRDARRGDARVEPAAGTPAAPKTLTDKQAYDAAQKNIDAKFPGIEPGERMRRSLIERDRLLAGGK